MRIHAEDVRIDRLQKLQKIVQCRMTLEEERLKKEREELKLMLYAEEQGCIEALEPDVALALATATRETFEAEEKALMMKVKECMLQMETLQDEIDSIQARKHDAQFQIGRLRSIITRHGLPINLERRKFFQPQFLPSTLSFSSILSGISKESTSESSDE